MGVASGRPIFKKYTQVHTMVGPGTTVNMSTNPLQNFTFAVIVTGIVLAWNIVLEGSLDGTNFSIIATHTNLLGAGVTIFPGGNVTPCLYFRTKCTSLSLGLGGSLTAHVLGAQ